MNGSVESTQMLASAMDADGEALAAVDEHIDDQDRAGGGTVDPERKNKGSYASKVVASTVTNCDGGSVSSLMDKDVIMMEEDVIIDKSRAVPSIQFSDRVHHQVYHNMCNAIIVHLL
ncbi:hypothetical protein V6N12_065176 [Hibiscus sabdariffa]|uniref:Uncharacterized protein n=1 Tax=Hibiscus sabdariffa TaxID=183260 RepID=A0ABR2G7Z0_9ROSI